ncbi:hypothetical protein PY254_09925 [Rhodanobacter sp. AS-Z3]|uniref:hypothetical protein n=1 Tax=Rhodanobacter sp. AS-Z3 TaxID=3031330 RepID=UPI002478B41D|nr:hypothetical protein [Rhodanobacter sp. AS-Z3]WEN13580.1 hypothetical protein PY254_09925 [Rhodanobacter sp. AS-Z3]
MLLANFCGTLIDDTPALHDALEHAQCDRFRPLVWEKKWPALIREVFAETVLRRAVAVAATLPASCLQMLRMHCCRRNASD